MERPRVRGSDHELDVLLLAISAPLSCVVEMPGHNLLQRGGRLQRLKVGWKPPHRCELLLALIWHVPVAGEGSVPPQIPLVRGFRGPFAVGRSDRRGAVRKPGVPGFQPRNIAHEQPYDQGRRLVDPDLPTRQLTFRPSAHWAAPGMEAEPRSWGWSVCTPQPFIPGPAIGSEPMGSSPCSSLEPSLVLLSMRTLKPSDETAHPGRSL